jgi:hypothetical protein
MSLNDSWGQEDSPYGTDGAYLNAIASSDPALAETVKSAAFPGENLIDAALRVLQTYTLADSQRRLLNVQVQRAQQGLPALDTSQYGLGVNFGLSPDVLKYGAFALLGVGALYFMTQRPRRR